MKHQEVPLSSRRVHSRDRRYSRYNKYSEFDIDEEVLEEQKVLEKHYMDDLQTVTASNGNEFSQGLKDSQIKNEKFN